MTPERLRLLSELYDAAAAMDPQRRTRFIDQRCASDNELRRELMNAFREADSVLAGVVEKAAAAFVAPDATVRRFDRYQVLRIVGEGGMGVVYEAEQDHPRRIVALKVIKAGLASAALLRRFERESAFLARLQHPGIAQIYETGAAETPFGPQPYFAMEFIHGVPLSEYVDAQKLDLRRRLELMTKVCDAVEHAHQRGIIHRDLKPANILVDQSGQPKILDFGIARATDSDSPATQQTNIGQLVGTLAYMSPEQVTADPLDLDTRSDVYALGVILYELLAARLPYTISNHLPDAVRTICEQDPERLSSISRIYRGDIETIAGKALEKDKTRRYTSAAALADDLRRYLADEPIAARPASTTYQLQKFARRHRALVGGVAAVFVALAAGVVVSTWQAVRARRAEQTAVEAQRTAQAINDFLQNDLLAQAGASTQAGPSQRPDPDLKVRTALDRAAAKISGKFGPQPGVEAAIRDTIGQTYLDLGLYAEARTQLDRALELQRRILGAASEKTLKTASLVGYTAFKQGKHADAERLISETLETQRRILGPENPGTLTSSTNLASVYYAQGNYAQAEALDREILEIRRRVLGPDHPDTLSTMNNLAIVYYFEGKYQDAEGLYRQTMEGERRVLGPEHPKTLGVMNNLAADYLAQGKYSDAQRLDVQTLDLRRQALGPEHPDTLLSMSNLAVVYGALGKFPEAEALDAQLSNVRSRVLGAEHPDTLMSMNNLAHDYLAQGKYAKAEALDTQILETRRRVLGPEHPDTLMSMTNLADDNWLAGQYAHAEGLFNTTLAMSQRALGPEHPQTLSVLADSAAMYQHKGNYAMAEKRAGEALAGRRHALGANHPDTMASAADLAFAYQSQGKYAESEPLAREALAFYRKNQPDDWPRFRVESLLGASLTGQEKYAEAEPLLIEGYQGMEARRDRMTASDVPHLNHARDWIVQLYQSWGKPEQAAQWRHP